MNNQRRHFPALDGVRGAAALMVFCDHYGGGQKSSILVIRIVAKALAFGWAGVSLFFVLSGFLITGILWDSIDKQNWWKSFYFRRSLRIFPLYYFSLALIVASATIVEGTHWRLESILPFAVYLQDVPWTSGLRWQFPYAISLSHFWSLAVEEQFYLVWPLLLLLFRRNIVAARNACCCLWLLSFLYRAGVVILAWKANWAAGFLLGRGGELAAGAWLALALRDDKMTRWVERHANKVLALGVLLIALVIHISGTTAIDSPWMLSIGISFISLFCVALVAETTKRSLAANMFSMPWLRWTGKISYGFYIYQILLLPFYQWVVAQLFPKLGWNAMNVALAGVAFAGTLAAASLSYYGFERHFLKLKERLTA